MELVKRVKYGKMLKICDNGGCFLENSRGVLLTPYVWLSYFAFI